jgi:hypothetical protein
MFTVREDEGLLMLAIRLSARVLSLVVVLFLALFVLDEGFDLWSITAREYVGLVFFPVGLVFGSLVAWRSELAGGLISVISILGFYLVFGLLLMGSVRQGWAFVLFALPGALFLVYGIAHKLHFHIRSQQVIN